MTTINSEITVDQKDDRSVATHFSARVAKIMMLDGNSRFSLNLNHDALGVHDGHVVMSGVS